MAPRRELLKTEQFSVSYLTAGAGPPMVIIPASEQNAEWWADVGYLDLLVDDHFVVIVDPAGHGGSTLVETGMSAERELAVTALAALLEHEEIVGSTVWGFSGGAEYASVLARRRPDLAARAVVGSVYMGDARQSYAEEGVDRQSLFEHMAKALEASDWDQFFELSIVPTDRSYQNEVRRRNDPLALARQFRSALRRVSDFVPPGVPTFAYWGEDETFHQANLDRVDRMPIEWATMPGSRADVFRDAPGTVALVRGFLRPVSARL